MTTLLDEPTTRRPARSAPRVRTADGSGSETAALDRQTAAAQRLRTTMAAVRLSFTWFGVRKSLTLEQKARAADAFGAEGELLSAGKKLLDTKHPAFKPSPRLKTGSRRTGRH